MKAYNLVPYLTAKIKSFVDTYIATITTASTPAWNVVHFDYEPDEGSLLALSVDGAIVTYVTPVSFSTGSGSSTGTQDTENTIVVQAIGFGDPIPNDDTFLSSTREAQRRAEILVTLAYRAIMDQREVEGDADIKKWYNSGLDISDRFPKTITKGKPIGAMDTKRAVCVYKAEFSFNFTEDVPSEPLGPDYGGPASVNTESSNPT